MFTAILPDQRIGGAENVARLIVVGGHQIAGIGLEHDPLAIAGDLRAQAVAVGLTAGSGHADPRGRPVAAVMDKDVLPGVVIAADQIAGIGAEGHESPVIAQRGCKAVVIGLGAAGGDADAGGRGRVQVVDEDVPVSVAVPGHQIAGQRAKGNELAVAGDRRLHAVVIGLHAQAGNADADNRPGDALVVVAGIKAVFDEDVLEVVVVLRHEVAGVAVEGHSAAVVGDRGSETVGIAFGALDAGIGHATGVGGEIRSAQTLGHGHRIGDGVIQEDAVHPVGAGVARARTDGFGVLEGGAGVKHHELAIAGNPTLLAGLSIRVVAGKADLQDFDGGVGQAVAQHALGEIPVAGEHHAQTVIGDRGRIAAPVQIGEVQHIAAGIDVDPLDGPGIEITQEDIGQVVDIAGQQVACAGAEGDHVAIVGNARFIAVVIGLGAVHSGTDALDLRLGCCSEQQQQHRQCACHPGHLACKWFHAVPRFLAF